MNSGQFLFGAALGFVALYGLAILDMRRRGMDRTKIAANELAVVILCGLILGFA